MASAPSANSRQLLFLYMILVRKCHSVAHRQDRRASRRSRTVPRKLILPHVGKAHSKVTRLNLLLDSLVKVYPTWVLRAVHRHSRLGSLVKGSSVWSHSLNIHRRASYTPHFLLLLATSYSDVSPFFCTDHFLLFDVS
jgi:hypothetical protein